MIASFNLKIITALSLAQLIIAGCLNMDPVKDTTQFYILRAKPSTQSSEAEKNVFIRNLNLADYLINSQLVQMEGPNTVRYLSRHRWAGSLEKMISRVLVDELSGKFPEYNVSTVSTGNDELILDIYVLRFDFELGNEAAVTLEYTLSSYPTRETIRRDSIIKCIQIADGASMQEIVELLEETLRDAAGEINLN